MANESIHRSMMWFLQMAQLSTTISGNHRESVLRPLQSTKRPHPTPKETQHSTIRLIDESREYEDFLAFNNSSAFTFLTSKRAFPLSFPSFLPLVFGSSSTSISSAMVIYSIIRIGLSSGIRKRLGFVWNKQDPYSLQYGYSKLDIF